MSLFLSFPNINKVLLQYNSTLIHLLFIFFFHFIISFNKEWANKRKVKIKKIRRKIRTGREKGNDRKKKNQESKEKEVIQVLHQVHQIPQILQANRDKEQEKNKVKLRKKIRRRLKVSLKR